MAQVDDALLNRAFTLLIEAAAMLRIEAEEWRARRRQMATGGDWTPATWAERCERIAATNTSAATSMDQTAKKLAEAIAAKVHDAER